MRLLAGCPVLQRAWILPEHLDHLAASAEKAGVDLELVHVGGPDDVDTWAAIDTHAHGRPVHRVLVDEPRTVDKRDWATKGRKHRMVELRNLLLTAVRAHDPDLFLSIDSDILLHPDTISNLIEDLDRFDAVGGHCYMTSGVATPSYLVRTQGGFYRPDRLHAVKPVRVIMAIKLMSPPAFWVDYRYDHWGEDIGWSDAAREAGLTLGWDSRVVNKHVHDRALHGLPDKRYDW